MVTRTQFLFLCPQTLTQGVSLVPNSVATVFVAVSFVPGFLPNLGARPDYRLSIHAGPGANCERVTIANGVRGSAKKSITRRHERLPSQAYCSAFWYAFSTRSEVPLDDRYWGSVLRVVSPSDPRSFKQFVCLMPSYSSNFMQINGLKKMLPLGQRSRKFKKMFLSGANVPSFLFSRG